MLSPLLILRFTRHSATDGVKASPYEPKTIRSSQQIISLDKVPLFLMNVDFILVRK